MLPIPTLVGEKCGSLREVLTLNQSHPAVAAGDLFRLLKAEAAEITKGSDLRTAVFCKVRL